MSPAGPLVVVGDALLDRDLDGVVDRVCPDAPVPVVDAVEGRSRPGGAGLAAALAAAGGDEVVLVTAVAEDAAGQELCALLDGAGVDVVAVPLDGRTPEKVRIRSAGQSLLRLDHGGSPGQVGPLPEAARRVVSAAGAILVADYGRGVAAEPEVHRAVAGQLPRTPVVWDPHTRGPEPVPGLRLATPNQAEAARLVGGDATGAAAAASRARALAGRWQAGGVAVTLGAGGAVLAGPDGPPLVVPAVPVDGRDPCGAGDRFSAAAAMALRAGCLVSEAVEEAVRLASAFVAAGGAGGVDVRAAGPAESVDPAGGRGLLGAAAAGRLAEQVRAGGGTVVATGGCFDLLHAGHVGMLRAARQLGDCLIVLLNADASVHRLKGPDRPLQPEADRAAVLLALDCVDAVVLFGEDTPVAALDRLRPDLFAKGADYAVADLPEAGTMARWGGEAVVLPYLPGRSTTRLLEEARRAR